MRRSLPLILAMLAFSGTASAQALTASEALEQSLAGLPGEGPAVLVKIETSLGEIHCQLAPEAAPRGVATFVGLAMGTRRFIHHTTRKRMKSRFYDGLSFHRVIPMFGIQGGDPRGDGTGGPGFIERMPAKGTLNHDRAGTLSMVSTGKDPTYGSQFFISEKAQEFLNGKQLVIGHCQSPEVIRKIARVKVKPPNRPVEPVKIIRVDARRGPALVPKSTK